MTESVKISRIKNLFQEISNIVVEMKNNQDILNTVISEADQLTHIINSFMSSLQNVDDDSLYEEIRFFNKETGHEHISYRRRDVK